MRKGIDISNLQGPPDTYRSSDWYQAAEFVIVQAINPPAGFPGHSVGGWTAEQLRTAKADGKAIGVYVFLWDSLDLSVDIPARLALIPDDVTLDMRLWLDVEDTSPDTVQDRRNDVLQALQIMDQWSAQRGLPPAGVYTGQWYIDGPSYLGGWFPDGREEWIANYDQNPVLTADRTGYQYYDHPVDLDAFADSEFNSTPTPPEADMKAIDYVPQDYRDKFGAQTPADVYSNLEGIISGLQGQIASGADALKIVQIKAIVNDQAPVAVAVAGPHTAQTGTLGI